jgi:curved DNA-binding protein CbpA
MSVFDPYAQLGVARAASPAAIKTAYRQRVQVSHPDRGGDPDAFIAVVKAFGLLSDPDARKLFDETGIIDDDGVANFRRDVTKILVDMFDAAVESAVGSGLKLTSVNFIAQMTSAVRTGLADARGKLSRTDGEIDSLALLRKRIRRGGDGDNLFVSRLDAQIVAKTEQHGQLRRRTAMLEAALVELGNYESEVELISALEAAP